MQLTVEAPTAAELFENVATTLTHALLPDEVIGSALREKFVAEADSFPALLEQWIRLLLRFVYQERTAFSRFNIISPTDEKNPNRLEIEATGELFERSQIKFAAPLTLQSVDWGPHAPPYRVQILFS